MTTTSRRSCRRPRRRSDASRRRASRQGCGPYDPGREERLVGENLRLHLIAPSQSVVDDLTVKNRAPRKSPNEESPYKKSPTA